MMVENLENRRLFAVTVENVDGVLTITDADGGNGLIEVRLADDGTYVVRTATATPTDTTADDGTAATPGGCFGRIDWGTILETPITGEVTSISIDAGAGDDHVRIGRGVTAAATIDGGDGNDNLSGGAGADDISGGAGNDRIRGGAGVDVLSGGAGNDNIDARDGEADTVDGGADESAADGSGGDIAVIDDADTAVDVVTNVEATRTGRFFFGGGGHHGRGFGGFGGLGARGHR